MSHILPDRYVNSVIDEIVANKNKPSKHNEWERNVIDEYKHLSNEEIKQKVEETRLPYAILMTNINMDYNLGAVLRIGNCLGAKVYYYGERKWDKRSAVGVWNYSPITYLSTVNEVQDLKKQYTFVALEQTKQSQPIHKFVWPKNPLIIVGEESRGLQATPEIFELTDYCVEIIQKGSVRSMNAATSTAIAAYDFIAKHNLF